MSTASLPDLPLRGLELLGEPPLLLGAMCDNMSASSPDMGWYGRGDSKYTRATPESGKSSEGQDVMGGNKSKNVILATNHIVMKKFSDKEEEM